MPILRGVLGKVPSGPKARVRNFIANKEVGTKSDIHENVISPGVIVPWHFHETEEVIRRCKALQRSRRLKISFCEIFGIVRFSTFAIISAQLFLAVLKNWCRL